MVRLKLFYQKSYYLLCLLLFFSCSERYDLYDEATFLDAYTLKKAKKEYSASFQTLSNYDSLYSAPQWSTFRKLTESEDVASYYVLLKNGASRYQSHLIINRKDFEVSYFIFNLPSEYDDLESYMQLNVPKAVSYIKDTDRQGWYLTDTAKVDVATRAGSSRLYFVSTNDGEGGDGSGGDWGWNSDNKPFELPEVVIPANTMPSVTLPEVEIIGHRPSYNPPAGLENVMGAGGGGGSSGSTNGEAFKNNTDSAPDVDPCKAASQAEKDQALVQRAQELLDKVSNYRTGDKEYGWVKTTDGRIIRPAKVEEERMSYDNSQLSDVKIVERYHNHPGGGGAFPSWADLIVLASDYKKGRIDVDNFLYGVVSEFGCLSLVVTSKEAFKIFANKVSSEDEWIKESFDKMKRKENPDTDAMIGKYIDFLTNAMSGLEVLYSPAEEVNGNAKLGIWGAKISDGNGGMKSNDCGK